MKSSRRQRLRHRITIFTIVALLWSQFALAGHPAASMAFAALDAGPPAGLQHGCQHPTPSDDAAVCAPHCTQGDQSRDATRIPPVPASLPAPVYSMALIAAPVDSTTIYRATPLVVSWHRPTLHPASILLI
ncbi:hypothetical protein N792_03670 [Lysobacter concretionis Ko07 = DSM 16239]|uniref:DUF2946 domain-containing protein n=2 Tax=Novilysobacter TaxID=3382699 RepID=A0A0A0EKJ6_9GAMM|nr:MULTISPECIES: hypothetical protein [Lysobacter]KGM50693.1 hypothetical protein N792_03670 [Lysobacter concretionis Ko07 = DSM 16239]QOD90011.1 hypothetical protein H2514_06950 [Lysobacter sp. CW239]QOW18441.1 hypothetical protein INQ41_06795 [Lysobacter ciconiae]